MKTKFGIGDKVRVCDYCDNEGYVDFRDKILIVVHVATCREEHPGYDEGLKGEGLYDFETEDGTSIGCSLYDYELVGV